jgi:N-acetylneuraminate lyase
MSLTNPLNPKYTGIIPAFYACYDDVGEVSPSRTQALARHLLAQGVQGLYVNGSSGECIYLSLAERKLVLESVMAAVGGKMTVIAHVACNNTRDSVELARHAESLNVNAIAAIPPIYFHLPEHAIAKYWNDMSAAAPKTDFIICNNPLLAGVALTMALYQEMLRNPRLVGVKNSSMPVQDIQMFKDAGGGRVTVFNGSDEQFIAGRVMGAAGGIGGTYAAMPKLYLKANALLEAGEVDKAQAAQNDICRIICAFVACRGNIYAVIKELLRRKGISCGSVRLPLAPLFPEDTKQVDICEKMIREAEVKYLQG